MKIKTAGKMNRGIKIMKCSQCNENEQKVDKDTVSVLCWRCSMKKTSIEIKNKK